MIKLLRSRIRGSAIPLVMIAVMILFAMGVGILSLGYNSRIFSIRITSDIAARCAADAGLTMALFEMNQKLLVKPYTEGTLPAAKDVKLPYTNQVCSYKVTSTLGGNYTVESIGTSGLANGTVTASIGLYGAFDHAILTKETLVLKSGIVVDGYNSLDPGKTNIEVEIGSQSTSDSSVILNNGVTVCGDVFVASGADLERAIKDLGATIKGDKFTSAKEPLPIVTAPTLPNMSADISAKGKTVTLRPADSGTYTEIDLESKGKKQGILEISDGDVKLHITGNINLGNSCEIVIRDGSTLTIYIDGDIVCNNSSGINNEDSLKAAETLQIYATGEDVQNIDIKAKSDFTGIIYAPNGHVVLYAKGDVNGAVVAYDFEFKAGGNFNYDEALKKKNTVDDEAVQFKVVRWSESQSSFSTVE